MDYSPFPAMLPGLRVKGSVCALCLARRRNGDQAEGAQSLPADDRARHVHHLRHRLPGPLSLAPRPASRFSLLRHSREGGNPAASQPRAAFVATSLWIPAFAGMTKWRRDWRSGGGNDELRRGVAWRSLPTPLSHPVKTAPPPFASLAARGEPRWVRSSMSIAIGPSLTSSASMAARSGPSPP